MYPQIQQLGAYWCYSQSASIGLIYNIQICNQYLLLLQVALVNVIHIKDNVCTLPTCLLAQYLKQANGRLTTLKVTGFLKIFLKFKF